MSTPNFSKKNARDYHCVGLTQEDDDFIDWYFIMEEIREVAKEEHKFYNIDESDSDRYRTLNYVTEKNYEMQYGGERYYATVMLGIRSGYYSGANIDYDIILKDDIYGWPYFDLEGGDTHQLAEDCVRYKEKNEQFSVNKGIFTIHRKKLEKRLEQWLNSIVEECEDICKKCAEEELVCTVQFSNGEAIYERKTPRNELKAKLLEVV